MAIDTPLCGDLYRLQVKLDNGTGIEWTNIAMVEEVNESHSANVTEVKVKEKKYPVVTPNCSNPEYTVDFTALFGTDAAVDAGEGTVSDNEAAFAASSLVSGLHFMKDAMVTNDVNAYRMVDSSAVSVEFNAYITSFSRSSDGSMKYSVSLKAVDAVTINEASV